jgi:acyl-CoA thioester hydrolase
MRSMTQTRVRFAETDAAGIVHYAQYLGYLEAGRAEALRGAGVSSELIAAFTVHARLLEADIRYRAPAHFDEMLEIHTWVVDVAGSQFRFGYEIQRPGHEVLVATGETMHAWTDSILQDGAQPPYWLLAALNQLRP